MRKILGGLIMVAAVVVGLWLGLWVMFIGGIVQFIDGVTAEPDVNGRDVAWGVVRVIFASLVGWLSFYVLIGLGWAVGWAGKDKNPVPRSRTVASQSYDYPSRPRGPYRR